MVGRLLAWERVEADGAWWAWVSWVQESATRVHHKAVQVRADSLRQLEPPEAYQGVPRPPTVPTGVPGRRVPGFDASTSGNLPGTS